MAWSRAGESTSWSDAVHSKAPVIFSMWRPVLPMPATVDSLETWSDNDEEISIYIAFIPLETGLLLLSYRSMYTTLELSTSIVNSFDCSPTVVYRISSKFYMVCVSSHWYVAVYKVLLNATVYGSMIEGAALIGPLTNVTISYSLSSSHLSNLIILWATRSSLLLETPLLLWISWTKQTGWR